MPSKYQLIHSDFYIGNSDIPINKLDIDDSKVIHEFENTLLFEAYEVISKELNNYTLFNEQYFRSLHKRTFESLYDWAGEYRSSLVPIRPRWERIRGNNTQKYQSNNSECEPIRISFKVSSSIEYITSKSPLI